MRNATAIRANIVVLLVNLLVVLGKGAQAV